MFLLLLGQLLISRLFCRHVTGDPRIYGRVYFATGGRGVLYGEPAAGVKSAVQEGSSSD